MKLLMKLQLVGNFVSHFSLCSDGETHQIQVLSFDTAYGITIGSILQSSVRTSKSVLLS